MKRADRELVVLRELREKNEELTKVLNLFVKYSGSIAIDKDDLTNPPVDGTVVREEDKLKGIITFKWVPIVSEDD